ncbi:MAG: amidohydrolase family protein [Candidatus Binatia bacterium]
MAKNGYQVMDSDMHVYDPPDLYLNYMDRKWGDRIPRGEWPKGHGRVEFRLGDGTVLRPRTERIETGEAKVAARHVEGPRRGYDPVSQVAAMDQEGLDVAVLFRTSPLYADDSFEPEYALALCRAWNDWIAGFCKHDSGRLKPSALIPMHDVDLAAQEARRAVEQLGVVCLSIGPEPVRGRQLHDRYFDPLWAEAQEIGVAVSLHPPASPGSIQASQRFEGHPNDKILVNAFRNPVEQMFAVGSMCAGGVLERFPRLKVAFLEGNCSWLNWTLYRLDERFELGGHLADAPLKMKPSEYFKRQCFISVDVDEDLVADVIRQVGDDCLVISTDYPHIDSKWPHAVDSFLSIPGVGESARRKILWDNCARLYNLS